MTDADLTRRTLVGRALRGGALLTAGPALLGTAERARAASPSPAAVHLTFGGDPAREMVVSWTAPKGAARPGVRVGPAHGDLSGVRRADTAGIVDGDARVAKSARAQLTVHHAALDDLRPDTDYVYEIVGDGTATRRGTFRTAPAGRAPFRFTAFGDQGTGDPSYLISARQGRWIVDQVEARDPLLNLHLGDLAYANLQGAGRRGAAWDMFMNNNARSAASRPWMPILGNHEIESGNGKHGYGQYLGRFRLPGNRSSAFDGHWYAFTIGGVRFVNVDAEDWALQKGGDVFLRGYSGGAQVAWLKRELAASRKAKDVDWIVLNVHHPLVSSADLNGPDVGVREAILGLVAEHGVDLVLSGHDHDYERSFLLGAAEPGSPTLRPQVLDRSLERVDTTKGWVQLVLGGGGTSVPTAQYDTSPEKPGQQAPVFVEPGKLLPTGEEDVTWSAVRDESHPYGFAQFDVKKPAGGKARIEVTAFRVATPSAARPHPAPVPADRFVLERSAQAGD
jgi:Calcineurin-like phosphoesterase/Purple acid Phosphatase, N-terminal domain